MNVENLRKLKKRFEDDVKFEMSSYIYPDEFRQDKSDNFCKTSACIAGHALLAASLEENRRAIRICSGIYNNSKDMPVDIFDFASEWLGLRLVESIELFHMDEIKSKEDAIVVLDSMIETGEIECP